MIAFRADEGVLEFLQLALRATVANFDFTRETTRSTPAGENAAFALTSRSS
jgi:hypothetical protein